MSTAHHQAYTRFTFELPAGDHKRLKAIAALSGVSLKELIMSCLKETVLSENTPNDETLKIFKETDGGKNLTRYRNADDLIDKLGLK